MKTMKTLLWVSALAFSHNLYADSYYKISGEVKIIGAQTLLISHNGSPLNQGPATLEYSSRPSGLFGKGNFLLSQGKKKLALRIPKDRYLNEKEFNLFSTDAHLIQDINLRVTKPILVKEEISEEKEDCMTTVYTGTDSTNKDTNYATLIGKKTVKKKVKTFKSSLAVNFSEMNRGRATFSGDLLEKNEVIISESMCKYVTGIRH